MVNALTILTWGLVAMVVVAIAAYTVTLYNRVIRVQRRADAAWSDIDVLLKQRREALEKLVDAASEVMEFEDRVLTELTRAREQVRGAGSPREEAAADQSVQQAIADFSARFEDYPELRSAESMQRLQAEISTLEQQIADRREVYNKAATAQNELVQQIPYLLFAKLAGIGQRELYSAPPSEKTDVDVSELGVDAPTSGR